ncbi:hypothetical protein KFU94_01565 [Chloroflexi bacterium TSY]|nr:hypothetical protein [Chloroflexi bacterium TSY]
MKYFLGFVLLLFLGVVGWRIGESLSSDATALLVLVSSRPREESVHPPRQVAPPPPVIVVEPPEHAKLYDVPVGTNVSELQRSLPGCYVVRAVWATGGCVGAEIVLYICRGGLVLYSVLAVI